MIWVEEMNKCECYRIRTERRYFSDYEKDYAAASSSTPDTREHPYHEDWHENVFNTHPSS